MAPSLDVAALYHAHAPYLWRAMRRMGMSAADADDLCQEVFLVAHRKLAEFRGDASPRTWLYGIGMRLVSDHRRRAQRRSDAPGPGAADAGPPEPGELVEQRQARLVLDDALAALDEPRRAVFVLYEVEDLSLQEIATCLEVPLQTVYSRLKSARAKIEERFRAAFATAPDPARVQGSGG